MCSNGVTSATSCTPARAKSGRPAGKLSSTIHCVNGSDDHGPRVGHAEFGGDRRAVGVGGFRHDAVHHRRRAGDVIRDPLSEFGRSQVRELRQDPFHGMAVGRKIVAGENGEGRHARRPPARQCGHDESRRRSRRVGICEVMDDVGMVGVEFAGLRRVAIAFLGDRQRDDARGGIGHARDQLRGIVLRDFRLQHRADDPMLRAGAGANGDRVETILRGEGVVRVRTSKAGADDSPIRCA